MPWIILALMWDGGWSRAIRNWLTFTRFVDIDRTPYDSVRFYHLWFCSGVVGMCSNIWWALGAHYAI